MSDLSLQRAGELVRGVIEILWNKSDGLPSREVMTSIPVVIKLSKQELEVAPAGFILNYESSLRLAILPLVKIGWLVKTKQGYWMLTSAGRDATRRFSTAQQFYLEALKAAQAGKEITDQVETLLEIAEELAWRSMVDYLLAKPVTDIRRMLALLLEAMHYHVGWLAPAEKQRGVIDLIASVDQLGIQPVRIVAQIKHKGQAVTTEGLKSFYNSLGDNDFGLLFSSGGFTPEVRNELATGQYHRVNAMDLVKFHSLWLAHLHSLTEEAHELFPVRKKVFHYISLLN